MVKHFKIEYQMLQDAGQKNLRGKYKHWDDKKDDKDILSNWCIYKDIRKTYWDWLGWHTYLALSSAFRRNILTATKTLGVCVLALFMK